jgi:hypothetical protein
MVHRVGLFCSNQEVHKNNGYSVSYRYHVRTTLYLSTGTAFWLL